MHARPGAFRWMYASGDPEHKSAWDGYLRKGDDSQLARLDTKALTQGTDAHRAAMSRRLNWIV